MVTIKDIAERAGVSFSTVSKALRNSPLVREETKRRILDVARELGYQPNFAARRLVSRKSWAVGVVWPSVERTALSYLITRINAQLERLGYVTLFSINEAGSAVDVFRRFQVDAILVFDDRGEKPPLDERAAFDRIPILVYGTAGRTPFPTVDVNRSRAIRLSVRHLAELGHRRVVYVGRPAQYDPLQEEKIAAFRREMAALGLPCPEDTVLATEGMAFHDGYLAMKSILGRQPLPTAVITGSLDLARGIVRAALEAGLAIPRGLSVVSYDNIPLAEEVDVPVTTAGVPAEKLAETIAARLVDLIERPENKSGVTLEPELAVRASTAPPAP
jgi:LacI family transcriptional regulator